MQTYLIMAFFTFIGLAYIIFGKISSDAYNLKPFDPKDPPKSQARYFWNVYREAHPQSFLPQALIGCLVLAFMTLAAAGYMLSH